MLHGSTPPFPVIDLSLSKSQLRKEKMSFSSKLLSLWLTVTYLLEQRLVLIEIT